MFRAPSAGAGGFNDIWAASGSWPQQEIGANGSDNVGSGYWTHVVSAGETYYLTKNKATAVSAFEVYDIS